MVTLLAKWSLDASLVSLMRYLARIALDEGVGDERHHGSLGIGEWHRHHGHLGYPLLADAREGENPVGCIDSPLDHRLDVAIALVGPIDLITRFPGTVLLDHGCV